MVHWQQKYYAKYFIKKHIIINKRFGEYTLKDIFNEDFKCNNINEDF